MSYTTAEYEKVKQALTRLENIKDWADHAHALRKAKFEKTSSEILLFTGRHSEDYVVTLPSAHRQKILDLLADYCEQVCATRLAEKIEWPLDAIEICKV